MTTAAETLTSDQLRDLIKQELAELVALRHDLHMQCLPQHPDA